MNAVPKPQMGPQTGKRAWTDAQRAQQAAKLRTRQIWLASTGPRTAEGKTTSSRNARKPDYEYRQAERAEMRAINAYLYTQKSYADLLRFFIKQEHSLTIARHNAIIDGLNFLENELIALERHILEGLRFSDNMLGKIIPFPKKSPPP